MYIYIYIYIYMYIYIYIYMYIYIQVDAITDMFNHAKNQGWLTKGRDNNVGK
jgi:hypothetical protein